MKAALLLLLVAPASSMKLPEGGLNCMCVHWNAAYTQGIECGQGYEHKEFCQKRGYQNLQYGGCLNKYVDKVETSAPEKWCYVSNRCSEGIESTTTYGKKSNFVIKTCGKNETENFLSVEKLNRIAVNSHVPPEIFANLVYAHASEAYSEEFIDKQFSLPTVFKDTDTRPDWGSVLAWDAAVYKYKPTSISKLSGFLAKEAMMDTPGYECQQGCDDFEEEPAKVMFGVKLPKVPKLF